MTLANFLTSLRLLLLAPGLYFYMKGDPAACLWALGFVIVMELSDMFDGMVARAMKQVSDTGKILDPFADHIYRLSFFLFFLLDHRIPVWMFLICFYRDSLVLNLRIFASGEKKKFIGARVSGKVKAIVQSGAIMGIILMKYLDLKFQWPSSAAVSFWLMFAASAVTLWSAVDYFIGIASGKAKI
jgi:CDP-diacylglycerol---glycerol-3-phosphate 3-phosphatidyltransferase